MTLDDHYSLCNKDNLQQPFQMKLCKKQKNCLICLLHPRNLHLKFNIIKKKDDPHRACLSEIIDPEERRYLNVYNVPFQDTLEQSKC